MKTIIRSSTALASLAAAFIISSCSLPPREAWQQIKQEGLITFLTTDYPAPAATAPTRPAGSPATDTLSTASTAIASKGDQFVGPPGPGASIAPTTASHKASTPTLAPLDAVRNLMPSQEKPKLASTVPSLPGYVRTPYTVPPRLVDVRNAAPGATMVCPYTQRPFIIPSDFVNQPPAEVASNTAATTKPMAQPPTIATKESAPSTTPPVPNPPANALFNKSAGTTPSATASTTASQPAAPEIPYGMPIPNRPGFVNSPFAAKHQLVDVTGLPVGMEVKCPYTGKLFKVPAADIAEQKAVASPGALPAPEIPEKK